MLSNILDRSAEPIKIGRRIFLTAITLPVRRLTECCGTIVTSAAVRIMTLCKWLAVEPAVFP